jgi:type III restriction enzyme
MKLKKYQRIAINDLLTKAKRLLAKDGERVCVFKAPTGSGKTIMVADFLQQIASEQLQQEYAFIWISSYDLHTQSKEKLQRHLTDSSYTLSSLEEVQDDAFRSNEIVFVNWHSLTKKNRKGEWSNVLMRDSEDDRNLPIFVRNTKRENREIVLIVDESHHHYWSTQSQELVHDVIGPKLTIEVSATPTIEPKPSEVATGDAGYVVVPFDAVVGEGMIKSNIVVNKEIGKYQDLRNSVDDAVIDASIAKQIELSALFKSEGSEIRPLILIQLPSETQGTSALDKSKLEAIEAHLADKHGLTVENGKLAIWLSERKENLENISLNDDDVQVLIFKQAIALGWDCPRAHILVMFREIKNPTFEIQTVGRILRMPEAKHYDTPELNEAFVYTNLGEIRIAKDDDSQNFFNVYPSHREKTYKAIDLPSVYLSRLDYGDITLSFRKLFFEEANKRFGITAGDIGKAGYDKADKDLELYLDELTKPVISDAVIKNIDGAEEVIGEMIEFTVPEADLKYKFQLFAKVSSLPFAPVRSHTKIQQAIYDWFDNFLGYRGQSRAEIQRVIVCSEINQKIFSEIIQSSKKRFEKLKKKEQNEKQRIKKYVWNVPAVDYFNEGFEEVEVASNVMSPCYLSKNRSNPEKEFEVMLGSSGEVSWWYKNRESKETYLAIPYVNPEDGETRAFYPDYIVQMKDGSVGVYDTKSGFTAKSEETTAKSDALQDYIKKHKKKRLSGGIVLADKTGTFVFSKKGYNPDLSNDGWNRLQI